MLTGRLRRRPKSPLAVAAILATPLVFVALLAFSLALEKPSVEVAKNGSEVLGDPTGANEAAIWLSSLGVAGAVVIVGLFAILLPARIGVILPAVVAIAVSLVLQAPLAGWEDDHAARFPQGVDRIPPADPGDLALRGEWEENARHTAEQIGRWTIVLALVAIAMAVLLEVRHRRKAARRPVAASGPVEPPGTTEF